MWNVCQTGEFLNVWLMWCEVDGNTEESFEQIELVVSYSSEKNIITKNTLIKIGI